MTIKTFNPNRVGGGTFELEQDATTGEYKLKEVGFIKLPELKLPEIVQADPIIPDPADPADPSDPSDPGTGGGGSGNGGGQDQTFTDFDYTGTKEYQNIQKQATGDTNLTEQAKQFSASDIAYQNYKQVQQNYKNAIDQDAPSPELRQLSLDLDRARANVGMATTGDQRVGAVGDEGFVGPDKTGFGTQEVNEDLIDRGNPTGDSRIVSEEQGLVGNRVPDRIMERTSQFGALAMPQTTTQFGVPDAVKFGQPSLPDPISEPKKNILQVAGEKAKKIIDNSLPVKALAGIGRGLQALEDSLLGPQQVALNRSNKNALNSLGYKTRGELGGSTDPNRIAGNPADNVFAGMNATSARGNIMTGSANRIKTRETVGIQRVEARYGKNSKQAKDFRAKTETFKNQRQEVFDAKEKEQAKINQETMNQGPPGGTDKERDSKIVCTMMNKSYGFGSFRNKIWMKFHGNISPEYQKGYHKLFLPLVNYAKQKGTTNKIIKNILEHIAVHSTIDMRQTLRGKTHILGRVYRKIILPLCYLAGRK